MPHQCTHCGEIYPDASKELLTGCSCGSKFFYYIRQERLDDLNKINNSDIEDTLTQLNKSDKDQIEKDIREITGMTSEPEKPVVLDLESIRVLGPGKFEIDLINLFSKKRPIIYRLEEGKYILDLSSTYKTDHTDIKKKIRDPKDHYKKEDKKVITVDTKSENVNVTENIEEKKEVEKSEETKEDNIEEKKEEKTEEK